MVDVGRARTWSALFSFTALIIVVLVAISAPDSHLNRFTVLYGSDPTIPAPLSVGDFGFQSDNLQDDDEPAAPTRRWTQSGLGCLFGQKSICEHPVSVDNTNLWAKAAAGINFLDGKLPTGDASGGSSSPVSGERAGAYDEAPMDVASGTDAEEMKPRFHRRAASADSGERQTDIASAQQPRGDSFEHKPSDALMKKLRHARREYAKEQATLARLEAEVKHAHDGGAEAPSDLDDAADATDPRTAAATGGTAHRASGGGQGSLLKWAERLNKDAEADSSFGGAGDAAHGGADDGSGADSLPAARRADGADGSDSQGAPDSLRRAAAAFGTRPAAASAAAVAAARRRLSDKAHRSQPSEAPLAAAAAAAGSAQHGANPPSSAPAGAGVPAAASVGGGAAGAGAGKVSVKAVAAAIDTVSDLVSSLQHQISSLRRADAAAAARAPPPPSPSISAPAPAPAPAVDAAPQAQGDGGDAASLARGGGYGGDIVAAAGEREGGRAESAGGQGGGGGGGAGLSAWARSADGRFGRGADSVVSHMAGDASPRDAYRRQLDGLVRSTSWRPISFDDADASAAPSAGDQDDDLDAAAAAPAAAADRSTLPPAVALGASRAAAGRGGVGGAGSEANVLRLPQLKWVPRVDAIDRARMAQLSALAAVRRARPVALAADKLVSELRQARPSRVQAASFTL